MHQKQADTRRPRSKLLVFFAAVFILAGIFGFCVAAGPQILNYMGSSNWRQVPAKLDHIRGESEWRRNDNSSTRVYTIKAQYRYSFEGIEYTASQVTLDDNFDSEEHFWRALETQLRRDNIQSKLQAWVNPQNPQQALLDRQFRWSKMVAAVILLSAFSGFGALVIYLSGRRASGFKSPEEYKAGIKPNELTAEKVLLICSIIVGLISLLLVYALPSEMAKKNYPFLFTMLFPLAGLALGYQWLKARRLRQLFGATLLRPDPLPGCAGGQVGGEFEVNAAAFKEAITVNLECASYSRRGKDTQRTLLWQDHQSAYAERSANGSKHRFCFDVPDDLPATHDDNRNYVRWTLMAEGEVAHQQAKTFKRSWHLPVVHGNAHMADSLPLAFREKNKANKQEQANSSALQQIDIESTQDAMRIVSRSGRHTRSAVGLALFGLVFIVAGLFPLVMAIRGDSFMWLFGGVFCSVGLLILSVGIFLWGRELEVRVDRSGLWVMRSLLARPVYQRSLAFPSSSVEVVRTMRSRVNNELTKEYFALKASCGGVQQTIAEGIEGRHAAEALQDKLQQWLSQHESSLGEKSSVPESTQ